jgi:asparagine synthase (glutamine-hydrolysing)
MCGLSAIVEFEPGEKLLPCLVSMHQCIPHRGPDGEGFALLDSAWRVTRLRTVSAQCPAMTGSWRLGMAFRWLQIQDPGEASAQPMASPDGTVWLMFNGEVYNFRAIARELEQLGHRFGSASDTEVLLAAYMQWGRRCFDRLEGMWAMVVLDLRNRKIIISRDRFGIKPLFYYFDRRRLIIASEIKQLLAAGAPAIANRAAVARFVRNKRPATPEETFFKDIFAQPAATIAEIDLEARADISFQPYWRLDPEVGQPATAPPLWQACAKLEELLATSVVEHMAGRAPLGHLISGGLDSSLLAALAVRNDRPSRPGVGVSMVLATRSDRYDETAYIDAVASGLKLQSFRAELTAAWLKANIPRISKAQEEPVAGMAVAGQFLAYEAAARHGARVVLDGQGADEIFGGYPRHQYTLLMGYIRHRALVALSRELMSLWRRDPKFFRDAWRLRLLPRIARFVGLRRRHPAFDFLRFDCDADALKCASKIRHGSLPTALDNELRADVLTGNLRAVLAITDRNAMAHSIEARVPYVDRRIVEFAFQLPDEYKVGDGTRKRILRLLGGRYLPDVITSRVDRVGFGAPIEQWLRSDFRGELTALAEDDVFGRSSLIDRRALRNYIGEFLAGRHREASALWRLYAIYNWVVAYGVRDV